MKGNYLVKFMKPLAAVALCAVAFTGLIGASPALAADEPVPDATSIDGAETQAATTVGVWDLKSSVTVSGLSDDYPGTVTWNRHPAGSRTGLHFATGEKQSYTVTLPKGLEYVSAPFCTNSDSDYWSDRCVVTKNSDGTTTITATNTRTGAASGGQFANQTQYVVNVRTTSDFDASAPVGVVYTPVSGDTSGSPSGSTTPSVVRPVDAADITADAGAEETVTLTFTQNQDASLMFYAPAGTSIVSTNHGSAVISPDGKTASFGYQANWGTSKSVVLKLDDFLVPGTVLAGGKFSFSLDGSEFLVAPFDVTVGDEIQAPTVAASGATVAGTGIPGASVDVFGPDGSIIETVPVGSDGKWSADVSKLGAGEHALLVSQTYGSSTSTQVPVAVDLGATVQIVSPANGDTTSSRPTFTGKGEPGATVKISGTTKVLCSTTVDANGRWSCESSIELADGDYALTAVQTLNGVTSTSAVSFRVKAERPVAVDVVIDTPADGENVNSLKPTFTGRGEPGATVVVRGTTKAIATATVDADGRWTATSTVELSNDTDYRLWAEQTPTNGAANSTDEVLIKIRYAASDEVIVEVPTEGGVVTDPRVVFTGKGEPGAEITVSGTTKVVATATVGADGSWTAASDFDLADGDYKLTVKQVAANGDLKETSITFTVKA